MPYIRYFYLFLQTRKFCKPAGLRWVVWFLLYTRAEIDCLRIGAICKDLPPEICPHATTLLAFRLLRQNRQGTSLRLTPEGYSLLQTCGFDYSIDKSYRCDPAVVQRRIQMAEIMMFFDRIGADVFLHSPVEGKDRLSFLSSAILRQKAASNVLGNTKLFGFFYTPDTVYIPYRLDGSGLYTQNEERIFHANGLLLDNPPAVIYTGQGSLELLIQQLMIQSSKKAKDHTDSYKLAMQKFSCPVCLVPLSEDGLRQFRIMTVPGYKEKLCRYLLSAQYMEPQDQWHDAINSKSGERYQIGFDFNFKDFDKGMPKHLIVLDFQREAAQKLLTGQDIILHVMNIRKAEQILKLPENLPELSAEPYKTREGGYLTV